MFPIVPFYIINKKFGFLLGFQIVMFRIRVYFQWVGHFLLPFLLKVLNSSHPDWNDIPAQIKRWNKAGGKVLQGLIRRREAEALLFEGKEWHEV